MEADKNENLALNSSSSTRPLIGYYLSKKKFLKLRFDQFLINCENSQIDTVELTVDYFHQSNNRIPRIIIHKIDEDQQLSRLIDDVRSLPSTKTIVIDRFQSISKLLDRFDQYSLLSQVKNIYKVPNFIRVEFDQDVKTILERLKENHVDFPLLSKPIQAHGEKSHRMKIIFDGEHLIDIEKPCVLQQFVDHDGVLFKIFLVGPTNFYVVRRNSIRNMEKFSTTDTISFHSSEVSSSQADHVLSSTDSDLNIPFDQDLMRKIATVVQKIFDLNLVGIDVIIDRRTRLYSVIDVNYFPGYEGVKDFNGQLFDLCQRFLNQP